MKNTRNKTQINKFFQMSKCIWEILHLFKHLRTHKIDEFNIYESYVVQFHPKEDMSHSNHDCTCLCTYLYMRRNQNCPCSTSHAGIEGSFSHNNSSQHCMDQVR
jgi:hypothetical protein